ncbi:hypothetical protein [Photorhabdus aegyptia]|nr:hypothetical protein [Photorhabdus aegyptia]
MMSFCPVQGIDENSDVMPADSNTTKYQEDSAANCNVLVLLCLDVGVTPV